MANTLRYGPAGPVLRIEGQPVAPSGPTAARAGRTVRYWPASPSARVLSVGGRPVEGDTQQRAAAAGAREIKAFNIARSETQRRRADLADLLAPFRRPRPDVDLTPFMVGDWLVIAPQRLGS